MNEILKKAQTLIKEAQDNPDFFSKYADNLIGTGEKSADYSLYYLELSDDYYLLVDFVDFAFENFSIVYKRHKEAIKLS